MCQAFTYLQCRSSSHNPCSSVSLVIFMISPASSLSMSLWISTLCTQGLANNFHTIPVNFSSPNRRFPEITGEDNLTVFSYSGRVKSPEWRWQQRRADLQHFEILRHGPVIIYTRLPAGGTYCPICTFPASREYLIGISDAFSAFVYGYPSSCPCVQCTPNKSVPTLHYTRRHGPIYTGPCLKVLTKCSPLDFRRSSIASLHSWKLQLSKLHHHKI